MADGSEKPIERVQIGDRVESYDRDSRSLVVATVLDTKHHTGSEAQVGILRVNGRLRLTRNHPVLTGRGTIHAEDLVLGDSIVTADGHGRAVRDVIRSIEPQASENDVYNIDVSFPGTFIVGGVVVFIKE
jgi:intein/homing endonuclease